MEGLKHIVMILSFMSFAINLVISVQQREFNRVALRSNERGPESIAFDCNGEGPYVGISDGRILKWHGKHLGWTLFAVTTPNRSEWCDGLFNSPKEESCGRPLGLRFNKATCELYIADSSFGLMKVGRKGGVATLLANTADGLPFFFLNGLDVDAGTGIVYFTDTSSHYHRWESLQAINNGDRSGRFMKYDPKSQKVTVLLKNLPFPNGVALSKKKDFVIVAETTATEILRYWLAGAKAGTSEVFLKLAGRPDNINRNVHGEFWIAQRNASCIKVDEDGEILEYLDEQIVNPSDVTEFHGGLWIGYVDQPYITHSF